ncbi:hypothetical protein [Ruthenibacterium lactatiformans]|uniref:hypothetical protein n=1 Tax=Ruthenibacterium lactatiformans TaxID=1550024 RepID=UPI0019689146|nr:hypothetical protein [Ruthenibacterium lactatiformans]MBN3031558.1 hypothetical protein [Ruthenibacterium lactatiformans]
MVVYELLTTLNSKNAQHLSMVFARLKTTKNPEKWRFKAKFQGFLLELLMRFERTTSSLPITFCLFSVVPAFCILSPQPVASQRFCDFLWCSLL